MIERFHYITQDLLWFSHEEQVLAGCSGGAKWVQLRIKNKPLDEHLSIARNAKRICERFGVLLIINDNVEIALKTDAAGVHLGKGDLPVRDARKILGSDKIIGATANTFEDIKFAEYSGADYVGLGPLRHTFTKENLSPILGLQGLIGIMEKCRLEGINIQVVAIGGIKRDDLPDLFATGIYGVAVSSAVNRAENPSDEVKQFLSLIKANTQINKHVNK